MQIGKVIKLLRINAGIRQRELAKSLGITQSYLSLLEYGNRQPSLGLIKRTARAMHLPAGVFLALSTEGDTSKSHPKHIVDRLKELIVLIESTRPQHFRREAGGSRGH